MDIAKRVFRRSGAPEQVSNVPQSTENCLPARSPARHELRITLVRGRAWVRPSSGATAQISEIERIVIYVATQQSRNRADRERKWGIFAQFLSKSGRSRHLAVRNPHAVSYWPRGHHGLATFSATWPPPHAEPTSPSGSQGGIGGSIRGIASPHLLPEPLPKRFDLSFYGLFSKDI